MERKTSEDAHWRLSTLPEHNLDPRMTDAKYPRPVRGIELMTRHSIYSIASMETEQSEDRTQHHKWNLKALRSQFERNDELVDLYKKYQQRLMLSVHLHSYLLLQILIDIGLILLFLLINLNDEWKAVPELTAKGFQLLMASLTLWHLRRRRTSVLKVNKTPQRTSNADRPASDQPHQQDNQEINKEEDQTTTISDSKSGGYELVVLTAVIVLFLIGTDFAIGAWFATQNHLVDSQGSVFYVSSTLYIILVIYNFLPIHSLRYTILLGLFVSATHVTFVVLAFYESTFVVETDVRLIVAEVVFYIGVNLMGIFMKTLNETTLRRAFLDKRKCIETTLKLNYEKSQEEKLMLSILPEHIASKVSKDIWDEVRAVEEENESNTQPISHRPFNNLYVETHHEVSILYADIVNFTPLTASLHPAHLVEMLNELFGKFDRVAKDTNCLRIKILGDCYYCVSGIYQGMPSGALISSKNHAQNCVDMGFRMIDIIRDVREDYRVDVDMRIGIHSGSIISGLLGFRKWQYDIWSRDVMIANRMEQSGHPGRVHISSATRALLGDEYDFDDGHGSERDAYLKQNEIKTFLVKRKTSENVDSKQDQKKIKFLTPELARAEVPPIEINAEEPSMENVDFDELSLHSLYEVLPDTLPVTIIQPRVNSSTHANSTLRGLPPEMKEHLAQKVYKPSTATSETDPQHELYSRVYKSQKRKSGPVGASQKEIEKVKRRSTTTNNENLRRGAVWMDTAMRDVMTKANEAMEEAIQNMRLTKFSFSQGGKSENGKVNFCLLFKDKSWEFPYLLRPDSLFGSYLIGVVPVLLSIFVMQFVLYQESIPEIFWWSFGAAVIVFLIVAVILWGASLSRWIKILRLKMKSPKKCFQPTIDLSEEDPSAFILPPPSLICLNMARLKESLWCRIGIFLIVCVSIGFFSMAGMDVTATAQLPYSNATAVGCLYKDPRIYIWYFTYSCSLAMTVIFGFYRMNFFVKLALYTVLTVVYSVLLYDTYPQICAAFGNREECLRCSPSEAITPELTHVLYLLQVVLILHVSDRQIEFIHRLDFIWQKLLISEQKQAYTTRTVNKLLLHNILPLHVAELYLDRHHPKGLYHEDYEAVAVMFASIPRYMDTLADNDSEEGGLRSLQVLNEIISGFDALLYNKPFQIIEKIKIVGSTYMAACGLTAIKKRCDDSENVETFDDEEQLTPLLMMICFAAAMEKSLEQYCLKTQQNFQLRIGISYGPVVAGVVGAEKPLYDIWGDTVNVASRLEYTGELGKIQVTEDVATCLEALGIPSSERGETFLKGKGLVKTYWIYPQDVSLHDVCVSRPSNVSSRHDPVSENGNIEAP